MNMFHLEHGLFRVHSGVLNYSFLDLLNLIMCERVGKNNCEDPLLYASEYLQTHLFFILILYYILSYFLDFRAQKFPLIFF